jgi:hypothetical protein
MASNPLASAKPAAPQQHPAMMHARIWQHVQQMQPDELAQQIEQNNYAVPILGKLAGDPKVTRKDVIKAAADAAGSGKVPPDQTVSIISQMPDDPTKLQAWLKGLYAANLTALVHMKAAAMPNQQQAVAPQQGVPPNVG